jgi:hypothetical protein
LFPSPYTPCPTNRTVYANHGAVGYVLSRVKKRICLGRRTHGISSQYVSDSNLRCEWALTMNTVTSQEEPNHRFADQRDNRREERDDITDANLPAGERQGVVAGETFETNVVPHIAGGLQGIIGLCRCRKYS